MDKKFPHSLAIRFGVTTAELTVVTLLLLFLTIGGVIKYTGTAQEADKLVRKAEASRFSEAEVDSLLAVASTLESSIEESVRQEAANPEAGRGGHAAGNHAGRTPKKLLTGTLAFNTASLAQLQQIPGVGPVMAQRLIEFRTEKGGKVKQFDDFLVVKGVGKKKLEVLKQHLTLE